MLYFAKIIFISLYFFFNYGRLIIRSGERRFPKVLQVVYLDCHLTSYYLDFFLVMIKVHGGPKSDKMLHIFRPRSQTFCSHARMQQNIVILKKKFLRTNGFSTTYATSGELWPTNP